MGYSSNSVGLFYGEWRTRRLRFADIDIAHQFTGQGQSRDEYYALPADRQLNMGTGGEGNGETTLRRAVGIVGTVPRPGPRILAMRVEDGPLLAQVRKIPGR